MSDFKDFAAAVDRLHALTSEPQPGLFSYAEAVNAVFSEVLDQALALGLRPRAADDAARYRALKPYLRVSRHTGEGWWLTIEHALNVDPPSRPASVDDAVDNIRRHHA